MRSIFECQLAAALSRYTLREAGDNPYHRAAVRKQQQLRALHLPSAQSSDLNHTERVNAFLDANTCKHGGFRSAGCSAVARTLSDTELAELIAYFTKASAGEIAKFRALNAPEIIIRNAGKSPALEVLQRELRKRQSRH